MTEGPGFYQGLRGRASGRPSPRVPIRAARREAVFAEHGLMSSGAADPNQGQLWSPTQLGPALPQETLARNAGIAPPLKSSQGGFMPGIERSTTKATRRAKVTALQNLSAARSRTGADRGSGAPVAEAMEDRQALYARGRAADWYQPVSEGRNVQGTGMAGEAIGNVAARTGSTSAQATRAVALTSPRTAWDEGGSPGTTDYKRPNIESAEAVINAVHSLGPDPAPEQVKAASRKAPGGTAIEAMKAKAGEYHAGVPTTAPIRTAVPASQKVPNFEQSLHMGHIDPNVVRGAAGSYTVDGWDVKGIGGDEKMLKSDTGYAVAHMTGTRAAFKNRELPPNFQASTWNALRDQPGAYGTSPVSMGTNRLFVSKRSGALAPNPNALAPERESTFHALAALDTRTQRRQGAAAKYDLEF